MVNEEFAARGNEFVAAGGIFITTYWSGIVNEDDLCYTGGFPGPLREVLGIWSEEIDSLYDGETNQIALTGEGWEQSGREYACLELCDLIHAETALVLGVYQQDFYRQIGDKHGIAGCASMRIPKGAVATVRQNDGNTFIFMRNYSDSAMTLELAEENRALEPLLNVGGLKGHQYSLPAFGVEVFLAKG